MKKLLYNFLILINFNLYSNLDQKINEFNKTQFASFLKSAGLLFCSYSAFKISLYNAKAFVNNISRENYNAAFDNFIAAGSTAYALYFLTNRSFYYLNHAIKS